MEFNDKENLNNEYGYYADTDSFKLKKNSFYGISILYEIVDNLPLRERIAICLRILFKRI